MPISVRIPIENIMMITTSWSLASRACPSWSSITDESALRSALASFADSSSSLHWWLGFWTFLVAFGVVLEVVFVIWEYLDELHDFRRGIVHAPDKPQTLLFVLGLLGAGLVAAGVSGELWKESQIATVETCIRKGNDALFLLLSKEAGDAATSAKTAHDEADTVSKEADAIQKRLDGASEQLANLEHQFSIQGPRWKVLEARKNELIKPLKSFAGQKVIVVYCGRWGTVPTEQFRVAQDLINFLSKGSGPGWKGAGWDVGGATWNTCGVGGTSASGGNLILVADTASEKVKQAAVALDDALNSIEISTIRTVAETSQKALNFFLATSGPGSPDELAAKDPTAVVLLVGDNPLFDISGWKQRNKARQKAKAKP